MFCKKDFFINSTLKKGTVSLNIRLASMQGRIKTKRDKCNTTINYRLISLPEHSICIGQKESKIH